MTKARSHSLYRLRRLAHVNILGLNSGTSLDGLDMCLLRVSESGAAGGRSRVLATASVRFPKRLRDALWAVASRERVDKQSCLRTEMEYSRWAAQQVRLFRDRNMPRTPVHALACHGQTVAHYSVKSSRRRGSGRWQGDTTWQLGSGSVLAAETGLLTVSDFRTSDIAAGGMGAPLSGYYHCLLFGLDHVVLNLGGIANVSVARRRNRTLHVLAFDIGPANMIIDLVAQHTLGRPYDIHGRMALRGSPITAIVRRANTHAYLQRVPPKSCGREEFGEKTLRTWFGIHTLRTRPASDCLATAVEISAHQIGRAIARWVEPYSPIRSLLLSGGGTRNVALTQAIGRHLPGWTVNETSIAGIDPQYVEPAGFAMLAHETLRGRPGNLGGATGASPAILGSISLPYSQ